MNGGRASGDDKVGNRIMSLMLLTCYGKMSLEHSMEV